jgi:hypothetical protein
MKNDKPIIFLVYHSIFLIFDFFDFSIFLIFQKKLNQADRFSMNQQNQFWPVLSIFQKIRQFSTDHVAAPAHKAIHN